MNTEEKRAKVQAILDEMKTEDLIDAWNDRCDTTGNAEEHIYLMSEFDNFAGGLAPSDIVGCLACDSFDSSDWYFVDDGINGVRSFDDVYDIIDDDELIDYIMEYGTFLDSDIEDIIDEDDEQRAEEQRAEAAEEEQGAESTVQNLCDALAEFCDAWHKLDSAWEIAALSAEQSEKPEISADDISRIMSNGYPLKHDFTDVMYEVDEWTGNARKALCETVKREQRIRRIIEEGFNEMLAKVEDEVGIDDGSTIKEFSDALTSLALKYANMNK